MKMRMIVLIMAALTTLGLAACNGGEPEAQTPADGEQPAAATQADEPAGEEAPAEEEPAGEEPAGEPIAVADVSAAPADLNYTTEIVFRLDVEGQTEADLSIEGVTNQDGDSSLTYDIAGAEVGQEVATVSIYDVEDTTYIELPDGTCVAAGSTGAPIGAMVTDMGDVLLDHQKLVTGQLAAVGTTEVNGVAATEYAIDVDNVADAQGLTNMTDGSLFVAEEGNYVLRLVLEGDGTSEFLAPGTPGELYYEMNRTPSDMPFAIEVPEGCIGIGMGALGAGDDGEDADEETGAADEDTGAEAPAPTEEPAEEDTGAAPALNSTVELTLTSASQTVNHACEGGNVLISSASNNVTLSGTCNEVTISGLGNTVDVASAAVITVSGANNTITYGGDPQINNTGIGNTLTTR